MAGIKKENRNRNSLIAENRFKKAPIKLLHKKNKKEKKLNRSVNFITSFLVQLLRKISFLILKVVWNFFWRISFIVFLGLSTAVSYYYFSLKEFDSLLDERSRGSVTLQNNSGEFFAWRGDNFSENLTANNISPHLKNAVLATEDRRFYAHFGISPRGIASAIYINLKEGRGPLSGHGGSTITQQTAKLVCLGKTFRQSEWESEKAYEASCRKSTVWRKLKEALYALSLEFKFSKDEIFTIYINRVFLGAGARGFEAAAQRYFAKSAKIVNPSEAAMLAGLLKAPTRYAPTNNLKRAQERANLIIGLMESQKFLSTIEAKFAQENPAVLSKTAQSTAGGYFADWVMASLPKYLTYETTEDVVITTTFDPIIQNAAEKAVREVFKNQVSEKSKAQAAIIVMSPNGAVRAMVGGREKSGTGLFNRATQALRQTGSSFKPIVYAAALEMGYSPNDLINDEKLTIDLPGSTSWTPKNYSNRFNGQVTLAKAFSESLNIPAVKISELVGRTNVSELGKKFGIFSEPNNGPAIALGTSEATLLNLVGAYASILNQGTKVEPFGWEKLQLKKNKHEILMVNSERPNMKIVTPETAQNLIFMMSEVTKNGTGIRAKFSDWEVAGKTGTSQSARDAWFIGFSKYYVAGVWMGYDDNTPLQGVTGGGLPADIWRTTMKEIHTNLTPTPLLTTKQYWGAGKFIDKTIQEKSSFSETLGKFLRSFINSH
jgi:1A family penicillin-binding protein